MYAAKLTSNEAHDRIRFDLETQRATYDMAKLELSYTRIVAPIDGVISLRMVKEGNLIQLHQALFRIDDFDPLLAVLNVPERELNILRAGLDVAMGVDALPGKTFTGTVARVSPVVDPATGTFRVTCEFRDEANRLKSGMFGRVSVVYDQRADALVIPREALAEADGKATVFIVAKQRQSEYEREQRELAKARGEKVPEEEADSKEAAQPGDGKKPKDDPELNVARVREVELGYAAGDIVEIRSGLTEGDTVVTVGRAGVRDGTVVSILESVQ
jgi:membrane fusion protein (multidrug efflux system)